MSDYYVSKVGDDHIGDGSALDPYLTITKALTVVSVADRIIISTGVYSEYDLNKTTTKEIKISTSGNGDVTIDGSAGGAADKTIRPYTGWVIDGTTGSYEFKIIGTPRACIESYSATSAFSLKNIIIEGKGDYTDASSTNRSAYGVSMIGGTNGGDSRDEAGEIKNCIIRNFRTSFVYNANWPGKDLNITNCLIYDGGYSGNGASGIQSTKNNVKVYFTTLTNFEGENGIYIGGSSYSEEIKNCIIAENNLSDSGISIVNGSRRIGYNSVYNNGTPTNGNYYNPGGSSLDSDNLELNPEFRDSNNKDFKLVKKRYHYDGSLRSDQGSDVLDSGVDMPDITTDIAGNTRNSPPSLGCWIKETIYKYNTSPTGDGLQDPVKEDFTINHYNRISKEMPRNVDQIPFSRLIKGVPSLKDTVKSYRLTKESK